MKSGLTQHIGVTFDSINVSDINKVKFMFRQIKNMNGLVKKEEVYDPSDESSSVELIDEMFIVPFSLDDSYLFRQNAPFYMDTKIFLNDTEDNPETEIVELYMNQTLFRKEEAYE